MYKVVIIDDEPIIVEGLRRGIQWEKWDCEVVGTANSGTEGLEIIRREEPNILISDISMPGLDGLTMIAALKSQFEKMQITILTGYRDFDFAQMAIRLGVVRLLLKPSKMEELEEAIDTMITHLKEAHVDGDEDVQATSFVVNTAMEYINKNYKKSLKLVEVADEAYVSQWHLSKLLNRQIGKSFSDILNTVRVREAKVLLADPSRRIGDIAEEVGFLDMAHFSRTFKRFAGVSANDYRNSIMPINSLDDDYIN